jgi:hypothetical protein
VSFSIYLSARLSGCSAFYWIVLGNWLAAVIPALQKTYQALTSDVLSSVALTEYWCTGQLATILQVMGSRWLCFHFQGSENEVELQSLCLRHHQAVVSIPL